MNIDEAICACLAIALGFPPLIVALVRARRTALCDSVLWAIVAWLSWIGPLGFSPTADNIFVAIAFTGGAGVAVLGARRPHVFAWNFVVLGLIGVLILPLVEGWIIGARSLDMLRLSFLAAVLVVGIANYVPTRFTLAAIGALICVAGWFLIVLEPNRAANGDLIFSLRFATIAVPWLAFLAWPRRGGNDLDIAWRRFRDRHGFVWGERTREQFNRSAEHARLPLRLGWRSARGTASADEISAAKSLFDRLTQRFR